MRNRSIFMPSCAAMLCAVSLSMTGAARAEPAAATEITATDVLDIDGNGSFQALTDALLVLRYAFGLRGDSLIQGAIGQGATRNNAAQIESYLASLTATLPGNCSIAASPASSAAAPLAAGTFVQLKASCSSIVTPISYAWNNGFSGPIQTVAPQNTTTYTVTPSNSNGTGAAFNTTVHIVVAPGNCSVSQSPNTSLSPVAPGTNMTLSVSCGGGTMPTSCSWTNGIASTACSTNVAAPATTTAYSVTASNGAGSAASVSTTINVQQVNTPQNFCVSGDNIYPITWPANGQIKFSTNGFKDQRIAFRFVIPATFNPPLDSNDIGQMRMAEVPNSGVVTRGYTLSKYACDFQSGDYLVDGINASDTAPSVIYAVNNPNGYKAAGAAANLSSGDTVYLNVQNRFGMSNTCPYTSCDISLDFMTPK